MNEQRNLILAIVLTMVILFGYDLYMGQNAPDPQPDAPQAQGAAQAGPGADADVNFDDLPAADAVDMNTGATPAIDRGDALAESRRIPILNDKVRGTIRLTGGRIDDYVLTQYHETLDPESAEVVLLSPQGTDNPFYVDYGWVSSTEARTAIPGANTAWQSSDSQLSPGNDVHIGAVFTGLVL